MRFTVFGSSGFVGNALSRYLRDKGEEVLVPSRREIREWLATEQSPYLGRVVFCVGLTADFRTRPQATVEAHVGLLTNLSSLKSIESVTYLSSTRLYSGQTDSTEDCGSFIVPPFNGESLYNTSKLLGETFVLNHLPGGRVARLSNVYGPGDEGSPNFLPSILRDAASCGRVIFQNSPDSAKDFVSIADVVSWLYLLARSDQRGIFNLASGISTSNLDISKVLVSRGIACSFADNAPTVTYPSIRNAKISQEFGAPKHQLLSDLPILLEVHQRGIQNV